MGVFTCAGLIDDDKMLPLEGEDTYLFLDALVESASAKNSARFTGGDGAMEKLCL